jgi:hypothetical protein
MKKISQSYINNLINKVLNENLEEKSSKLVSRIKKEIGEGEITGEHPTFGTMNFANMTDYEIRQLRKKYFPSERDSDVKSDEDDDFRGFKNIKKPKTFYRDRKIFESMCNECGGSMNEGECSECGYRMESEVSEGIYDKTQPFSKRQKFDYVEEISEEDENQMELNREFCKYSEEQLNSGELSSREKFDVLERYKEKCGIKEELIGGQKKIDKNKNNKIDAEDFKLLRKGKKKETDEQWQGALARMAVPMAASYFGSKLAETDEEIEEGNAFTGALAKAKKSGKKSFEFDGETFPVKESFDLTEDELVDLIENIIKEQKSNIKTSGKPKGLTKYEQVHKASGKETKDYFKSLDKKMKDYLKNGSKGKFEMNPEHFPKGNGEIEKMSKKAYVPSEDIKDYVDNLTAAGQENLTYDEIHPNEDWVSKNIEGSSMTGNNPKWVNSDDTGINKKRNKVRKNNLLGKIKQKAYNKAPQPAVIDKTGDDEGNRLLKRLESTSPSEKKKLNEEFSKINNLINYDRKTQ